MHAEHTKASGEECAYVANVIPDLALAQAGVMPHDVIVAVNGSSNASPDAIRAVVRAAAPGDHVKFMVVRAGQTREADVTLLPWEAKHMVRALGQVEALAPASASSTPAPETAAAAAATAAAAKATAAAKPAAAAPTAATAADPAAQDELAKARARITDLERRMQADEAVRRSIRPQPMPAPGS
jgi:membrane-associated protease RseP (regulator of RpoE activity)